MKAKEFNFSRVPSHKPTIFINKVRNQWPVSEFLLTFQEKLSSSIKKKKKKTKMKSISES